MTSSIFRFCYINSYVNCQHDKNKQKSLNSMSISYYVPQYQGHEFLGPFVCVCVGSFVKFLSGWCEPPTPNTPSVIQIAHIAIHRVKTGHVLVGFLDSHRWLPSAIPGLVEYIVFARNAGRQDSKYEQKEISLYKSDSSRIVEFIGKLVNLCLFLCFFAFFSTFFVVR